VIDSNGVAVDLSSLGDFPEDPDDPDKSHVQLTIKETIIVPAAASDQTTSLRGLVTNATTGKVKFSPTLQTNERSGIYTAEILVYDSDNTPVFANQFYYVVNRGLNSPWVSSAPPTIAEIRLHLRDSGAKDNPLLQNVQFGTEEIALAIERPILFWNETLPPVQTYTTTTFPWRYNWMEATIGELYRAAAHFYRRNYMAVQGGGLSVNDMNKAAEYEQIADKKWAAYANWVQKMKIAENARAMMGYFPTGYSGYDGGI
jgi:hypothetical protein